MNKQIPRCAQPCLPQAGAGGAALGMTKRKAQLGFVIMLSEACLRQAGEEKHPEGVGFFAALRMTRWADLWWLYRFLVAFYGMESRRAVC